jgi:hypothetical protein
MLDEAHDMSLYLIGHGVDAEELAAYQKVSALLSKANFNREVSVQMSREWSRTMSDFADNNIPSSVALNEYTSRTTVRRSIVNAIASLLHIERRPQAYVAMDDSQQDRHGVSSTFLSAFSSYEKPTVDDVKSSSDALLKSVKTGCDNYNMGGGILCAMELPILDKGVISQPLVNKVVAAGEAAQRDKINLVSKIAEPFNFVFNNIDAPKSQSYEHAAMRASVALFPNTVFYCVDEKMSNLDLLNTQLTQLPDNYSPYIKAKTHGNIGDLFTNTSVYDSAGIDYSLPTIVMEGDDIDDIPYVNRVLEIPQYGDLVEVLVGDIVQPGQGFQFGRFPAESFVPARFGRLASVDDLKKHGASVQLISLSVLAGALKKSQYIFATHKFCLFDPMSQICFAIPAGYASLFPLLGEFESDITRAMGAGLLFITSNNAKLYMSACSELNSYMFPVLMRFYSKILIDRGMIFGLINIVLSKVSSVNGTAYGRVANMFMVTLLPQYVFLVGSDKIDDKKVQSFVGDALIDKVSPLTPRKGSKIDDRVDVIKPRVYQFNTTSKVRGGHAENNSQDSNSHNANGAVLVPTPSETDLLARDIGFDV